MLIEPTIEMERRERERESRGIKEME